MDISKKFFFILLFFAMVAWGGSWVNVKVLSSYINAYENTLTGKITVVKAFDVFVKGIGQGRDTAIRALSNLDIIVESITDLTGIAHGGVRPKKARRN